MRLLADKVVIVTGASRGIGAAAARVFADEGAAVVPAARNERSLSAIAAEIAESGGEAHAVATDVTDADAVERMVSTAVGRYGRLDGAFNNASSAGLSGAPGIAAHTAAKHGVVGLTNGAVVPIDGGKLAGMG